MRQITHSSNGIINRPNMDICNDITGTVIDLHVS